MIKFILPVAVFIAMVFGISYFWTNSSAQGRKKIALGLLTAIILSLVILFICLQTNEAQRN